MIYVALRFDDPSPSSNAELERGIIAALAAWQCTATFAVILFRRTRDELVGLTRRRADHLDKALEAGTVEIALHGFSHERGGAASSGQPSEFAGLALAERRRLLAQGIMRLRQVFDCEIRGFAPPWNSYYTVTLRVLETARIGYLSAGWQTPLTYRGGITILPLTSRLARLELAVMDARRLRLLDPVVVVVMHYHDFAEERDGKSAIDLPAFNKLLAWLAAHRDLALMPLGQIAERLTPSTSHRGIARHRLCRALPWRMQPLLPQYCLLTAPIGRFLWPRRHGQHRRALLQGRP